MSDYIKSAIKSTQLAYLFIYVKSLFISPRAQNDEGLIINRLIKRYKIPHTFIEFGFSGWEFNCASLVKSWNGLLIDGNTYNIKIARTILPENIAIKKLWLTQENLSIIEEYAESCQDGLGILSIDVDGNDYWFLERLIHLKPAIIIAEYNSSFGLKCITVPYDPNFDRIVKHETHTYYGASLSALNCLANSNGYSLIEVSNSGVNAFFIRNDLLTADDLVLKPETSFREKLFTDGSRPSHQWEKIKHLPYVDVTKQ